MTEQDSECVGVYKNDKRLNTAMSYLLEEHHNILETCQGYYESVLINTHMHEDAASRITAKSLAMRIVRNNFRSYMILLIHCVGINNTRGWED